MAIDPLKFIDWADSGEVGKIHVELQVGPGDTSFKEFPPVVRVFVSSRLEPDMQAVETYLNKNTGKPGDYVSIATPAVQRTLSVPMPFKVEGKKLPASQVMWVLVVPDGDWKKYYPVKWFPVEVRRGETVNLTISLTPIKDKPTTVPSSPGRKLNP